MELSYWYWHLIYYLSPYLLLHKKLPPNFASQNNKHCYLTQFLRFRNPGVLSWVVLAQILLGGLLGSYQPGLQSLKTWLGLECLLPSSLTWPWAGGLSALPHGPFHRAAWHGRWLLSEWMIQMPICLLWPGLRITYCRFYLIPFIRNESLSPAHTQWKGITAGQGHAHLEVGITGDPSWRLTTTDILTDGLQFEESRSLVTLRLKWPIHLCLIFHIELQKRT